MSAARAEKPYIEDLLSGLRVGKRPEPQIRGGWARVKVSHASLNRHDVCVLRGFSARGSGPVRFAMIMGNDEVGMLEDGAEHVVADPSDPSGFDTVDASPLSAGRRFGPVTGAFGIRLDAQQLRSVLTSEEGRR